jgi:hypothetical protein
MAKGNDLCVKRGSLPKGDWREAAIVGADRAAIFATIFTSAQMQRARLRDALSLVFGALVEGDSR